MAASSSLNPVLLGYTVEDLWVVVHPVAMIGWGLIMAAPFWRGALTVACLPPLILAVVYALILLPKIISPDPDATPPDINNMSSIQALFTDTDIFFCGWIHYLAFDQLVGMAVAHDALYTVQVSKLVYYTIVTACLFLTFYVGPVGFVSYMIARRFLMGRHASLSPVKLD
jgi:Domain of unknown function (DUF4281)